MQQPSKTSTEKRVGYAVDEWRSALGLSRSKVYELMTSGQLDFISIGRRRVIVTAPQSFVDRLLSQKS